MKGVVGICSVFSHVTTMPHARKIAPNSFANVVVDHSRGGVIGWKVRLCQKRKREATSCNLLS